MDDRGDVRPVSVLLVCTGNVCRSPFAAALLDARLSALRPGRFEVGSAGTHALVDAEIDPGSRHELASRGVQAEEFRGRQITADLLGRADLVIAMTAEQRSFLVEAVPPVRPRVVLLQQLSLGLRRVARRHDALPTAPEPGADAMLGRWRQLPLVVGRHGRPPWVWRVRDVPDPIGRGPEAFARMARTLDAAIDDVVGWESGFPS